MKKIVAVWLAVAMLLAVGIAQAEQTMQSNVAPKISIDPFPDLGLDITLQGDRYVLEIDTSVVNEWKDKYVDEAVLEMTVTGICGYARDRNTAVAFSYDSELDAYAVARNVADEVFIYSDRANTVLPGMFDLSFEWRINGSEEYCLDIEYYHQSNQFSLNSAHFMSLQRNIYQYWFGDGAYMYEEGDVSAYYNLDGSLEEYTVYYDDKPRVRDGMVQSVSYNLDETLIEAKIEYESMEYEYYS